MARAGMLHRGGKPASDGCDDVQRSLELLDQVLSEYDEGDPRSLEPVAPAAASAPVTPHTPATPRTPATDDDSPLAGHTSEDDGYMSMNGRRAKFALGFRPTEESEEPSPPAPPSPHSPPPPPEVAERIISTLIPKVSPANSAKRIGKNELLEGEDRLDSIISVNGTTTATQTTFPKTKHQRPYGWEKETESHSGFQLQQPPGPQFRFSSLQHGARPPRPDGSSPWLPARQHSAPNNQVRSPSVESPPVFPFMGFSNEFINKPYNEHPVTIYPGPKYNRQSPTGVLQKTSPSNTKTSEGRKGKRDVRSDEEMLSPIGRIPPRTLAGSMERHREVCRASSGEVGARGVDDEEHFSDDSLESFPPPPAIASLQGASSSPLASTSPVATSPIATSSSPNKRNSIAWEVSLSDDDPLLTPGSTKVVGRRRRKSGEYSHSSTGSIPRNMEDEWGEDAWPPPPEPPLSPLSDTDSGRNDLHSGTYVIRKGKNRKQLPNFNKNATNKANSVLLQNHSLNRSLDTDKSLEGSSVSLSGSGSVGSYPSRRSSELSLAASRLDPAARLARDLATPASRYSVDLGAPNARLSKELTSPKSRLSLDLNNGQHRYIASEYFAISPKSRKIPVNDKSVHTSKNNLIQNKLSPQSRFSDLKKYSSTFDNMQSLMKEAKVENSSPLECKEMVNEIATSTPNMVRVVSLPALGQETESNSASRQALITTVEEEEDQEAAGLGSSGETSPLRKIENNISAILNQGRDQNHFTPYLPKDWDIHKDEYCDEVPKEILDGNYRYSSRDRQKRYDIQKSSSHNEIQSQRSIDRRDRSSGRRSNSMHKSTSAKDVPVGLLRQSSESAVTGGDFQVKVQVVEHFRQAAPPPPSTGKATHSPESPQFPPLPPSPVQEVDDEYSEIELAERKHYRRPEKLPTPTMDMRRRPSEPPAVPAHRDSGSLKTRSMEPPGYSRHRRSGNYSASADRRTLPTDVGGMGARRRTLQRQREGGRALQTSASLPETPVFARCDLPRTPPRAPLPPRTSTLSSIHSHSLGGSATLGGYGRAGSVMGAGGVCTGADLLRMGGPARGWYPKQRHRPASTEHLDRLTASAKVADAAGWDEAGARKPLTLPPNLTPKFFHRSPREALRRVTSLLIRNKGNGKEKEKENARSKEATSPAARSTNGEDHPGQKQKRGFFKSLWKKSRHYSLEHP